MSIDSAKVLFSSCYPTLKEVVFNDCLQDVCVETASRCCLARGREHLLSRNKCCQEEKSRSCRSWAAGRTPRLYSLAPWTAWLQYKQQYGSKAHDGLEHQKNRHIAYRQLVRWCWESLGSEIPVPLPSCAVNCIRAHFPVPNRLEEDMTFTGFQYADEYL